MRIAHIILVHKNSKQLERLLKSLKHPDFSFYIHVDKKVPIDDFKYLEKVENVFFIKNRTKCNWGGNSLTLGIIASIKEIISLNENYDFISLISGQDYPIQSAQMMHDYLSKNIGCNFISYEEDENSLWWKLAVSRYEKYHFTDFEFKGKYIFERLLNFFAPKRKFPSSFKLYGGPKSTWWTLSKECAHDIVLSQSNNDKLNSFLKYCWGTDEFLIPTLIMNSKHKDKTSNNNLRYIDWSEGNARPKLLKMEDYIHLKSSQMYFARKFDIEIDETILDKIDKELIQS